MFNKVLLAAIAAGLWANAAATFVARPAHAGDMNFSVELDIDAIKNSVEAIHSYVYDIANGKCKNSKLC